MVAATEWRELYRSDDLVQARAVATSVAAMEFDVRLNSSRGAVIDRDVNEEFPGPYIIEVSTEDWLELQDVLNEIIDEQLEFDEWLEQRHATNRYATRIVFVSLIGVAGVLAGWWLIKIKLSGR